MARGRAPLNSDEFFRSVNLRYGTSDPDAFLKVLTPALIPIKTIDPVVFKKPGEPHWRASFTISIDETYEFLIVRGRTGKFVPGEFLRGQPWRELAKGRIITVDRKARTAEGEIYVGSQRPELDAALKVLKTSDFLEIDHYGAAAKVLSGLVEYQFVKYARGRGFIVHRMPEDMAAHLGTYPNYDFELERNGVTKKVEVKSLWGTDTRYARLIHSLTDGYKTSSCKFETQDIFAVSLFLRTGNVEDFAFARSVSSDKKPYGLPPTKKFPEYVNQNPKCAVGDGRWFPRIEDVWDLA